MYNLAVSWNVLVTRKGKVKTKTIKQKRWCRIYQKSFEFQSAGIAIGDDVAHLTYWEWDDEHFWLDNFNGFRHLPTMVAKMKTPIK